MYNILIDTKMQIDEMKRVIDRLEKSIDDAPLDSSSKKEEKTRELVYRTNIDLNILRSIHENINNNISNLIEIFGIDIIKDMREKIRDMQDKISELSKE